MLINELSKKIGVSVHTIRYYENLGLISGKSKEDVKTNNYKDYDDGAVERLEIILEAKEVGFTLAEIRNLLECWFENISSREDTIKLFKAKITEIDNKIKQFKKIKKRLEQVTIELENNECEDTDLRHTTPE
ncbi:MerR family transcriptional regulator [Sphingobacterium sp.]|uniref:MerR family transcriptional regulator n=1 Tax=Sphingobacterium sp. TaxID=341027 RepID=UPI00289B7769|nr:MerR family transcriptional regulator [Sphingobacterium sp.]